MDEEPAPRNRERKPRRSHSMDSVSSVSTRSSRSPPPRRRAPPSPQREGDVSSPRRRYSRSRSFDSASGDSRRPSPSPERGVRGPDSRRRSSSRRSLSPDTGHQLRDDRRHRSPSYDQPPSRRAGRPHPRQQYISRSRSRSPVRADSRGGAQTDGAAFGRYRDRDDYEDHSGPLRGQRRPRSPLQQRGPPRERSLSPFSKRLALTQAMNMGR